MTKILLTNKIENQIYKNKKLMQKQKKFPKYNSQSKSLFLFINKLKEC